MKVLLTNSVFIYLVLCFCLLKLNTKVSYYCSPITKYYISLQISSQGVRIYIYSCYSTPISIKYIIPTITNLSQYFNKIYSSNPISISIDGYTSIHFISSDAVQFHNRNTWDMQ